MENVGIIAEFNPLHSGHNMLLKEAKKRGNAVCVISGNFVQRGDTAIIEKGQRAEAALRCGADLVLELPVNWAMSTAQNFALGGVSILKNIGCDSILFGSESGDINELIKTAKILTSRIYSEHLQNELKKGITFAAAREKAGILCGADSGILSGPNNNLAIEYITAAKKLNADIHFHTLKRLGAGHDSEITHQNYVSASLLRKKLLENDLEFAEKYIAKPMFSLMKDCNYSDIRKLESAILCTLRSRSADDFKTLPDLSEGIENKLYTAVKLATNLEELYNNMKVKRYTHARIRRLVLSTFLGIDNSYFMRTPPYIRVLGFNKNGLEIIKKSASLSPVPIITKVSQFNEMPNDAVNIFKTECRATDLYAISLKYPLRCDLEYTRKIIKKGV